MCVCEGIYVFNVFWKNKESKMRIIPFPFFSFFFREQSNCFTIVLWWKAQFLCLIPTGWRGWAQTWTRTCRGGAAAWCSSSVPLGIWANQTWVKTNNTTHFLHSSPYFELVGLVEPKSSRLQTSREKVQTHSLVSKSREFWSLNPNPKSRKTFSWRWVSHLVRYRYLGD